MRTAIHDSRGAKLTQRNTVKRVPEVCRVFCAITSPAQVIVAESEQGRGILGVIDGEKIKGIETDFGKAV